MSQDISASSPRAARIRHEDIGTQSPQRLAVKPERNLLAAVLGRAILDLYGEAATDRIIIASARNWLYGPLDCEREFSFGWVASNLNLDPVVLREKLHGYSYERESLLKCLNFLR